MSPVILDIFNSILATGIFPAEWKQAYITPIPKKGALSQINNYRGIAMQSTIPKLFDALLTKKIYQHVSKLIPIQQHGFMPNKSTTTNLLEITQFLHDNIRSEDRMDVVYFDYSKAFDQVDHKLLAAKLAEISMPYLLFKTIMNFIAFRTYSLKIDGKVTSNYFTSCSGVPQGSHCGPIPYAAGDGVYILVYADDTKMYRVINTREDMAALQTSITKLVEWSTVKKLTLNASKTVHVSFSRKRTLTFQSMYFIGTEKISTMEKVRDLGVMFDSSLTFAPHITAIHQKATAIYAMGYRFTRYLHCPELMPKIVQTYIQRRS